ncbi:putative NBD/HSP70 family sugar kinase [Inquilinus ginsengisoli]|uniref:NBD/HSP70 family sugar kinase n=1 Tax=Inquilinus ginsengisoli TaxID=363840 RepID=A0ABU1JPB7_9PROT|nr:ROK family transcriptional regulator [Inquilinus ginsengisoli]MDR6290467.1 putative NBD/HSP70 family sugar kinase [Inquilinus ginsengisoli]
MARPADQSGTFQGANLEHARALNRRAVFEAVRRHGPVTRAELARLIGLTVQGISNIATELEAAGLIRQDGKRMGLRGQPAVELSVNPAGGYTIGLSLAYRRVTGVLVDLTGQIVAHDTRALSEREPQAAAQVLADQTRDLLSASGIDPSQVWGVGCSVPGTVQNGAFWYDKVKEAEAWIRFPLGAELERLTGLWVLVENDATVAAIGERLYGVGRVASSFFYLHFNLGVGGGIVVDGQHYRGAFGGAGEIGHMIVKPGGRLCPCGSRGCLEQYVSLYAAAEAVCGPTRAPDEVPAEELVALLRDGDPRLLAWQQEAGEYLRIAIRNIEAMFDPDTIVIGGGLPPELMEGLIAAASPLLPGMTHRHASSLPRLVPAEHAADLPAMGAAALPVAVLLQSSLSRLSASPSIGTAAADNPALALLGVRLAG